MLIGQEKVEDILPHLQDTFLRDYIDAAAPFTEFSALADRCFRDLVQSIREECPSTIPADLFMLGWDYLNLKNALAGQSDIVFPCTFFPEELLDAVEKGERGVLPLPVREAGGGVLCEMGDLEPALMDVLLDGAYLRHFLSLAAELNSPLISLYAEERVLVRSVLVYWRAVRQQRPLSVFQQYFLPVGDVGAVLSELAGLADVQAWPAVIPGELGDLFGESLDAPEDEQPSRFEVLASNYLMRLLEPGAFQTAGPERVVAFLAAFAREIQNIRVAVSGRLSQIEPAILLRQLRERHV